MVFFFPSLSLPPLSLVMYVLIALVENFPQKLSNGIDDPLTGGLCAGLASCLFNLSFLFIFV
jgi:hypothetical protein